MDTCLHESLVETLVIFSEFGEKKIKVGMNKEKKGPKSN